MANSYHSTALQQKMVLVKEEFSEFLCFETYAIKPVHVSVLVHYEVS
jgi:hypothetical protein